MNNDPYPALEEAVHAWCHRSPDILAAIIIGSRGRQPASPDDHSDLDLILFCRQVGGYQNNHAWLNEFGEVWIAALNFVGPGHPEWMAYFAPGLKADFLLVPADTNQTLADMLDSLPYQQVLTRGFSILYQSRAVTSGPVSAAARTRQYTLPTESAFRLKVNATLFTAERVLKFSIRKDEWRSRYTFEAELKSHLLAFIEWHAQSGDGPMVDTWYEGRQMAAWADRRFTEALLHLDPGHEVRQQHAALLAFLDLLQLIAGEIAARLGYEFPTPGQGKMIAWLKTTMPGQAG